MDEAFVQLRNHARSQRLKLADVAAQVAYPQSLHRKAVDGRGLSAATHGAGRSGLVAGPFATGSAASSGNQPGQVERVDPLREVPVLGDRQPLAVRHALRSSCAATAGDGPANRSRSASGVTAILGSRMSSAAACRRVSRRCSTCGQ